MKQGAGVWLLVALSAGVVGCDAALIGGAVALAGAGAAFASAQCYDQVSVRVRDEQGRRTCDASVTLTSDGSARGLRPCYHASLTEGQYRISAQQDGYVPAEIEFSIPRHEGKCPHYTHTIELALRRVGAPAQSGFVRPKAPDNVVPPSEPARPRTNVPAPIPVPPASEPAPAPAEPAPPSVNPPAEPGPPSASFPPAAPAPPAPAP
ncbi:MAG TPA: hypothetical protein VFS67_24535 [Polyangiaceae bacterium]|nr:hypothetical protein [Polyangiaceae bacterium]